MCLTQFFLYISDFSCTHFALILSIQLSTFSEIFHLTTFRLSANSQCDQMARLFIQNLAIYSDDNLPKPI